MRTLVAAVVLAAATLAFADSSVPEAPSGSSVMLSLERTACYGRCPIYKVTVLRDGTVRWEGVEFVKVTGKATAKLPAATLAALADAFKRADYFALADDYTHRDMTDHPSAVLSYADGGKKKAIRHYHGDHSAPAQLSELESRVDELVGTAKWIGRER
jgi:hypothetical protein